MTTKPEQCEPFMQADLSRRTVLITGAALSLSSLPLPASASFAQETNPAEAAILKMIRNRHSAVELGKAAQMGWPDRAARNRLLSQILDDLQLDVSAAIEAEPAELANRLSRRIQTDFSDARTVKLDGWLLSLAEVRFYALAACNDRQK